jgi:membrane protease YdiL (CAAX protease family)
MALLSPPRDALPSRLGRLWDRVLAEPLRRADEESRAYLASRVSRRPDGKVIGVLLTAAVALTLQRFLGGEGGYERLARWLDLLGLPALAESLLRAMDDPQSGQINHLTYWALSCLAAWFVLPALVVRLGFRERLRDYGVKLSGVFADFWLYIVMLAAVLPLVLLASSDVHFLRTYPFYRFAPGEPLWPVLLRWEAVYVLQFFAVEFFFRGFLLHGTRRRFGCYAVFVMTVPYCMIHFTKPMPEALGSIVAGVVLGFMSLKTRSIWMGTAAHVTVALAMDFLSLGRQGLLGGAG